MLASEMPVELLSDKTASDLAPVFDVPVNISAVLGGHMSVAQLLQLNPAACWSWTARSARRSTST
jgi:flagellar motor switch protein FliN/FliY